MDVEIRPGQIFSAFKVFKVDTEGVYEGVYIGMKVQTVTEDGRAVISPEGSRRTALITRRDVLIQGGEIEAGGRLGRLIIPPQIGGNIDTKV